MEKRLKDYFIKTLYGTEDTRAIVKNIKEFIKDKYHIDIQIFKKSYIAHQGGSVTGGKNKCIDLNITSKDKFDLQDFMDNFNECVFQYENNNRGKDWTFSIGHYDIKIKINNVLVDIGRKWNTSFVDVDMVMAEAFDNISRVDYFINNKEKLVKIYNEKIKEDFIFEFNKKFKENFSDEDFILLIHKLTNGTMNVSNIIIERNKYINTNLTEEECENLTFKAKHMRLETNKTRAL